MFLVPALSWATNSYVRKSPEHKDPVFRRTAPGLVEINGAILRYSSTSGDGK